MSFRLFLHIYRTTLSPHAPTLGNPHLNHHHRLERHCEAGGHSQDTLIVAGDVSDDIDTFTRTFELLAATYAHVFFVVGNHELWVRRADRGKYDSLGKLQVLMQICAQLGVHTTPKKIEGVWIVPILSWYHASWDKEPDVLGALPIEKVMMDFHACDWSSVPGLKASGDDSLARHFDSLNCPELDKAMEEIQREREAAEAGADAVARIGAPGSANGIANSKQVVKLDAGDDGAFPPSEPVVISFSHFLPLQVLLPEKRWLYFPNLAKASGSDYLAARVNALAPMCHVYGHTHFTQDQIIEGESPIRYVQWPLGYPKEHSHRRSFSNGSAWEPMVLWDSSEGLSAQRRSYWSDFYKANKRQPHIVTPAPWAEK